MKLLALTNLYPPHHAGSFDLRTEVVLGYLRKRGHQIHVLTSNHGLKGEQRDAEIARRLWLNDFQDHPAPSSWSALRTLERHNHSVLRDTLAECQPELVYVWSLRGLNKSLMFALSNSRIPVTYDVADGWMTEDMAKDAWLRWWNHPGLPWASRCWRALMEVTGQRARTDRATPTRLTKGFERLPALYTARAVEPSSIGAFRFERIYFSSELLKAKTEQAGFRVAHGEVIYPGVLTEIYFGDVKPETTPVRKLLLVSRLHAESGARTALEALRQVRAAGLPVTLSIYGRGESEYIAQLRSFAVTHQLPVEFLNVSDQNRDLAAIYRGHDALLHTPEFDEPFSTRPFEAMACGLPVICSRAGGVQELLRESLNSLTFQPGDSADLAGRISQLCSQSTLRIQIAQAGQIEVIEKLNESSVVDRIEKYLSDSLEASRAG